MTDQENELLESAISKLDDLLPIAREIVDHLETAEGVECMSDWTDNLAEAERAAKRLLAAIKAARAEQLAETVEVGRSKVRAARKAG